MATVPTTNPPADPDHVGEIQLDIGGMTCASCAARIEKKLNRMEGVHATVNYATEKAKVTFADTVSPDQLIATVEATGYTAHLPAPAATAGSADPTPADPPTRSGPTRSCAPCGSG